jgi:hypothetical protein
MSDVQIGSVVFTGLCKIMKREVIWPFYQQARSRVQPYDGLVELLDRMLTIDVKGRADDRGHSFCLSAVCRPCRPAKKKRERPQEDKDKEKEKKARPKQVLEEKKNDGTCIERTLLSFKKKA